MNRDERTGLNSVYLEPEVSPEFLQNVTHHMIGSGVLFPIQDQGIIGSCSSFSVCEQVGSSTNPLTQLSPQHCVDCLKTRSKIVNEKKCAATLGDTFGFAENKGIMTAPLYKYIQARQECQEATIMKIVRKDRDTHAFIRSTGDTCSPDQVERVKIRHFEYINNDDYSEVERILLLNTPLSAEMYVTENFSQHRHTIEMFIPKGPIKTFIDFDGKMKKVKHALLIVGFGWQDQTPFYVVKNSHGTVWGHNGYAKIDVAFLDNIHYAVGAHFVST